ncbi:MAG: flagellar biosynthesis protein FlhB [Peptococcaceae bacterium]|nr:flagellar biosynthesis protein FlhB [Peptococcaceae bacterium]
MAEGSQEKTEQATPKRLEEARKKGQVSKSVDLIGALCLIAIIGLLFASKDSFILDFQRYFTGYFLDVGQNFGARFNPTFSLREATMFILKLVAPFFIVALLVVILTNLTQVGFLFTAQAIRPKPGLFNPIKGLERMFSRRSLVELFKSLLKFTIIGGITYVLINKSLDSLLVLFYTSPIGIYHIVLDLVIRIAFWAGLAYLALALLDFWYQRYEYDKSLKMSKQEVKDEFKQMEGDQLIRQKRREIHRSLSMNQIAREVPEATVVITNPTQFAVALRYDQNVMTAPKLVAKGAGVFAKRIKEVALEHKVPVMENKELARFIYDNVDVDQEIPMEIYQAVAQVLAMVYRLKAKENYRSY